MSQFPQARRQSLGMDTNPHVNRGTTLHHPTYGDPYGRQQQQPFISHRASILPPRPPPPPLPRNSDIRPVATSATHDPNASNHTSLQPAPSWTTLHLQPTNALLGPLQSPTHPGYHSHLLSQPPPSTSTSTATGNQVSSTSTTQVSYTPLLTLSITRPHPQHLQVLFESYPTAHLFPRVSIDPTTRTVSIKFRHSSFHRGLASDEEMRLAGGPLPTQYVITNTIHSFVLPSGFDVGAWRWWKGRREIEGGDSRNGAHFLVVEFYSNS